jgi:hypothetical protein
MRVAAAFGAGLNGNESIAKKNIRNKDEKQNANFTYQPSSIDLFLFDNTQRRSSDGNSIFLCGAKLYIGAR